MHDGGGVNRSRDEVRDDFIPRSDYVSREFMELENEYVWPRTWQVACRAEELPRVGSFVTYDIGDDSIVVIRTRENEIKAFFNVCQHRARRLVEGCGATRQFLCRYHGWRYDLDGACLEIPDQHDWGDRLKLEDVHLNPVQVDTWGGFVFINMDPGAEPLREFLAPAPDYLDPFEFERMRFRWYATFEVDCNWKVCLEAFNESYHVASTHPQFMPVMDSTTTAFARGKHAMFRRMSPHVGLGFPHPRLNRQDDVDPRLGMIEYMRLQSQQTMAIFTDRDLEAATRLMTEVPKDTPASDMLLKMREFQKEAAIASGSGWPDISNDQLREAGADWHIFPNLVFLMSPTAALFYRARPLGNTPDRCLFDIWSLQRYAPDAEPPLKRQYYKDWRDFPGMPPTLIQDFENIPEVQRGLRSRGLNTNGARTNPVQEQAIVNFHRTLRACFPAE